MIFLRPIDFEDALQEALNRKLLPTDLGSADIARWSAEVKRRSVFTARGTSADFLQTIQDTVEDLSSGKINQAKGRELLKQSLDTLEYAAESGFPGDLEAGVPPAESGSLRDLASEDRLNLILDTQARQVANFGYFTQGQTPFSLHAWPCWELIRIYWRRVPRGLRMRKGVETPDPDNAWPARWEKAGGTIYAGRLIARKDSDVWYKLGDPALFSDGLGQPYAPFAFNSGKGVREVGREESISLGVITANDQVKGQARSLNTGAQMSVQGMDADFLRALKADLDVKVKAGEARLRDEMSEAKRAYLAANDEGTAFLLDLMIDAANVFNPNQKRIPKGQPGAGQFVSGGPRDPMALGKTVKKAQKRMEDDLKDCGIDTEPNPAVVAQKLRDKLKVRKPAQISKCVTGITGGTQAERDAVMAHAQEVFDLLPPQIVNGHGDYKGLPEFRIELVDKPGEAWAGEYDGGPPRVLSLNRAQAGWLDKDTTWHEMGHFIHDEGPASIRAATQAHFRRRTANEVIVNNGDYWYKRDSFVSDYAGRIYYPHEPKAGSGAELPSTHLEHLATPCVGIFAKTGMPNSDKYKETMAVSLQAFYYGRPKK
jgi:hypothetical protein